MSMRRGRRKTGWAKRSAQSLALCAVLGTSGGTAKHARTQPRSLDLEPGRKGGQTAATGYDPNWRAPLDAVSIASAEIARHASSHSAAKEIAFIDPGVPHFGKIVAAMNSRAEIVVLNSGSDAVAQMAERLRRENDISAIHVFTHGDDGRLLIKGSTAIDAASLESRKRALDAIRDSLAKGADVLVYGCNVAKSEEGKRFADALSDATGADVAASTDRTGATSLHGDWDLEYKTGSIEASPLSLGDDFDAVLASPLEVTTLSDSGVDATINGDLAADTLDGGGLSLREAVFHANAGDTIPFASALAGGTIALAYSDNTDYGPSALAITREVAIDGSDAPGLVLDCADLQRHFLVGVYGDLSLKNLTLTNGYAKGGDGGSYGDGGGGGGGGGAGLGGSIFNCGTLALDNCRLQENKASGGNASDYGADYTSGSGGGGMGGDGSDGTDLYGGLGGSPNPGSVGACLGATAGDGGDGGIGGGGGGGGHASDDHSAFGGDGGNGGFGGGGGGGGYAYAEYTYALGGDGGNGGFGGGGGGGAYADSDDGDSADGSGGTGGFGAGDGYGYYGGGGAGMGGAIFNDGGTVSAKNCTIIDNGAYGGYAPYYGGSGLGGGIFNYNGIVNTEDCTISGNEAYGGCSYFYAGDGLGAGIFNYDGTLNVKNSTISYNYAYGGESYNFSDGYGGNGLGGGIFNHDGTLNASNCTIAHNAVYYGRGSSENGYGCGGGIFNRNGTNIVLNCTIAVNHASDAGGGIYNLGDGAVASMTLNNTIVAENYGDAGTENFLGVASSGGTNAIAGDYNAIPASTYAGFPPPAISVNDTELYLGTLDDNGGATSTIELLTGGSSDSPCIDAGYDDAANDGGLVTDQRGAGFIRLDGQVDIGAFELQTAENNAPTAVADGGAGFSTAWDTPFTTASVLDNDSDGDPTDTPLVKSHTAPAFGDVTDNGDGTFDYDPNGAFDGLAAGESDTDTFTYTVEDNHGLEGNTVTVTITVNGPSATDDGGCTPGKGSPWSLLALVGLAAGLVRRATARLRRTTESARK